MATDIRAPERLRSPGLAILQLSVEMTGTGSTSAAAVSAGGVKWPLKLRTVELTAAVPKAKRATTKPPAAMAIGAVNRLVKALACNPPRGMMLQVIP